MIYLSELDLYDLDGHSPYMAYYNSIRIPHASHASDESLGERFYSEKGKLNIGYVYKNQIELWYNF